MVANTTRPVHPFIPTWQTKDAGVFQSFCPVRPSVSQVWADLTPRHNVLGGRSAWVHAVAVLAPEKGPDFAELTDYGPHGPQNGFFVSVKPPNLTFTLLSWEAAIAHEVPGMGWLYGQRPGVYRVHFFQANWCMSCAKGELE